METDPGDRFQGDGLNLETFLVEWKPVIYKMPKFVRKRLETFLVEWKRHPGVILGHLCLGLETFLVEWKPSQGDPTPGMAPALKPS